MRGCDGSSEGLASGTAQTAAAGHRRVGMCADPMLSHPCLSALNEFRTVWAAAKWCSGESGSRRLRLHGRLPRPGRVVFPTPWGVEGLGGGCGGAWHARASMRTWRPLSPGLCAGRLGVAGTLDSDTLVKCPVAPSVGFPVCRTVCGTASTGKGFHRRCGPGGGCWPIGRRLPLQGRRREEQGCDCGC